MCWCLVLRVGAWCFVLMPGASSWCLVLRVGAWCFVLIVLIMSDAVNILLCEERKTNKMQQLDVYY